MAKNFLKGKLRRRNASSLNWRLISASDRNDLRASNLIESSIFTAHLSYPCQSVTPTNNVHIATRAPINKYTSNLIASHSLSTIIYPTLEEIVSWKEERKKRSIFEKESRGWSEIFIRLVPGIGMIIHLPRQNDQTRENFK